MTVAVAIHEVAAVAAGVTPENIEAAVTSLDSDQLLPYLARLVQITELAAKWKRAIEGRMAIDGRDREDWNDPDSGKRYWYGPTTRGEFERIPELMAELMARDITLIAVAPAIARLRVTDLRAVVQGRDDTAELLEIIEEYRQKVEGPSHLRELDERYVLSARTKRGDK